MKALLLVLLAGAAQALEIKAPSPNSGEITPSTITITGTGSKCFSVDDPTLVVDCNLERVGIGTASPATTLDINGTAQFGSGATKSTFSATGALTLASGANLGMAAGTLSASSVLADTIDSAGTADLEIGYVTKPSKVRFCGATACTITSAAVDTTNHRLSVGKNVANATLEVLSNVAPTGFALAISSQSDVTASLFGILGNGHAEFSGTAPTLSSCGGSPTIAGNDSVMRIVSGSAATACTVTFASAWTNAPICHCDDETTLGNCRVTSNSTTAITLANIGAAETLDVKCVGYR